MPPIAPIHSTSSRASASGGAVGARFSRAHFLRTVLPSAACFAAAGAVIVPGEARARGGETATHELSGVYRFVGGAAQTRALSKAIDDVVDQLSFVIRGVARRRLERGLQPWPVLQLDLDERRATLITPGQPRLTGPHDGHAFRWINMEGAAVDVRIALVGRTLRVRYAGDGAESRFRYGFRADGSGFELRGTIKHVRMPEAIQYRLSYARAE